MKLAQGLIAGMLMISASFSHAADSAIVQQDILARHIQDTRPEYYSYEQRVLGLQDEIKATWRYQKEEPRSNAYYEQRRRELRYELINTEERMRRIRGTAISQLEDNAVSNKVYDRILEDQKSSQTKVQMDHEKFIKDYRQNFDEYAKANKPEWDANAARTKAYSQNTDLKNSNYYSINEAAKGTPGFINEIKLTAGQKAQVVGATADYNELVRIFKGTHIEEVYARLRVLGGGKVADVSNADELKANFLRMKELSKEIEKADSKESLLAMTKELKSLSKPHMAVINEYRTRGYKIFFGFRDPMIQSGTDHILLDETGKVKGVMKGGMTAIKGKANIKAALGAAGLSALLISPMVMADEAPAAATTGKTTGFESKNWAEGVR